MKIVLMVRVSRESLGFLNFPLYCEYCKFEDGFFRCLPGFFFRGSELAARVGGTPRSAASGGEVP